MDFFNKLAKAGKSFTETTKSSYKRVDTYFKEHPEIKEDADKLYKKTTQAVEKGWQELEARRPEMEREAGKLYKKSSVMVDSGVKSFTNLAGQGLEQLGKSFITAADKMQEHSNAGKNSTSRKCITKAVAAGTQLEIDECLKKEIAAEVSKRVQQEMEGKKNFSLSNAEIRKFFSITLRETNEELDIVSSWMNFNVVDEEFIDKLERLLKNGVMVKILYGIGSTTTEMDDRNQTNEEVALLLKKRLRQYRNFRIRRGNTHVKLFICDDKYYVMGSFNILSFKGQSSAEGDGRNEKAECSYNKQLLQEYRQEIFDF